MLFTIRRFFVKMSEERFFPNHLPDFDPASDLAKYLDSSTRQLVNKDAIQSRSVMLLQQLENAHRDKQAIDWSDNSVYTGLSGYSLMFYFLYKKTKHQNHLDKAKLYADKAINHCRGKRISFICGDPGPLAVSALVYNAYNQQPMVDDFVGKIMAILPKVTQIGTDIPDEHLYGRSGYLYSLILLRQEIPRISALINDQLLRKVISAILESGKLTVSTHRGSWMPPLFYFWHDSPYLGAAHGVAGILYILLKCHHLLTPAELQTLVKPTLDFMLTQRFKSGNTSSSVGRERDLLVHWCHGAPGVVAMYTQGYKVFNDQKYLDAAMMSGDVIWTRGLLYKGYGICHGIAGNAYAFLNLFKCTRDPKHLHRALMFADVCLDYGNHGCRTPDSPYSLFEGMAGTIYFLFDIIEPEKALFPAYEVNEV